MESEHKSEPISQLKTNPAPTIDKCDIPTLRKNLSSSSSSSSITSASDSPSEIPFQKDANETNKFPGGITSPTKLDRDNQFASENGDKDFSGSRPIYEWENDFPISTLPSTGYSPELGSNKEMLTQSPPIQVMERSGEPASYRIPSSVFARTKSTAPMEWSVASNESLFSIHMGNMSFNRDQFYLYGKSGELGLYKSGELGLYKSGELGMPGEPTTSSQMMNFSSSQPQVPSTSNQLMNFSSSQPHVYKETHTSERSASLDRGLGASNAAVETMKEVIRENEEKRGENKSGSLARGSPQSSSISRHSDASGASGASVKSFAFPILTGDGSKSGSVNVGSVRPGRQHQQQPHSQVQSQPQSPAPKPEVAQAKWLSCFRWPSCCWPAH